MIEVIKSKLDECCECKKSGVLISITSSHDDGSITLNVCKECLVNCIRKLNDN